MKAVMRALDDSRPVTAALKGAMFATPNIADELDMIGFSYVTAQYDRYHATCSTDWRRCRCRRAGAGGWY